jgi:hypothetical protein
MYHEKTEVGIKIGEAIYCHPYPLHLPSKPVMGKLERTAFKNIESLGEGALSSDPLQWKLLKADAALICEMF